MKEKAMTDKLMEAIERWDTHGVDYSADYASEAFGKDQDMLEELAKAAKRWAALEKGLPNGSSGLRMMANYHREVGAESTSNVLMAILSAFEVE